MDKKKANRWFNQNRNTYLAKDGITYMGKFINQSTGEEEVLQICKVGENGVTDEDLDILLELDEEEDNVEFNQRRFPKVKDDGAEEDFDDSFIDRIPDPESDVFTKAFPEEKEEHILLSSLHDVVANALEPQQRKLYEDHICRNLSFNEIQEDEHTRTGKLVSTSGISKRWDKTFSRICKSLCVEKPKRRALSDRQKEAKGLA